MEPKSGGPGLPGSEDQEPGRDFRGLLVQLPTSVPQTKRQPQPCAFFGFLAGVTLKVQKRNSAAPGSPVR